ncbi:TIGR02530 family flagellar biosynthesis protein [Bacillus sp. V59.32b]|uniref:TIGR02530 family flagellar biosynthesis protein n=1 Tax=Bacillus sp. V59.32b TaxID=1758642 RepID=UPI000E3E9F57|nr:TIGR02530 family flagellar biosynthesis protein [Bacillus sp. V59.32b]RFU68864.1 flagellar protein [Bacillus sp. V59.32b]
MEKPVFRPITSNPIQLTSKNIKPQKQVAHGFASVLQSAVIEKTDKLVVSKHAQLRLNQRNINIDENTWTRIEEKVQEAKKMGVRETLVLTQDAALVVSAKNNTVITAMDRDEASSQIFTNINGTILLN